MLKTKKNKMTLTLTAKDVALLAVIAVKYAPKMQRDSSVANLLERCQEASDYADAGGEVTVWIPSR